MAGIFSVICEEKRPRKLIDEKRKIPQIICLISTSTSNEHIILLVLVFSIAPTRSPSLITFFSLWFYARSILASRQPSQPSICTKALIHSFTHALHYTLLYGLCTETEEVTILLFNLCKFYFIWFGNCLNIERLINQHCLFDVVTMTAYTSIIATAAAAAAAAMTVIAVVVVVVVVIAVIAWTKKQQQHN